MTYKQHNKTISITQNGHGKNGILTAEYYRKEDVQRALGKIHLDNLDDDELEYIKYACKPYKVGLNNKGETR